MGQKEEGHILKTHMDYSILQLSSVLMHPWLFVSSIILYQALSMWNKLQDQNLSCLKKSLRIP